MVADLRVRTDATQDVCCVAGHFRTECVACWRLWLHKLLNCRLWFALVEILFRLDADVIRLMWCDAAMRNQNASHLHLACVVCGILADAATADLHLNDCGLCHRAVAVHVTRDAAGGTIGAEEFHAILPASAFRIRSIFCSSDVMRSCDAVLTDTGA